MITFDTFAEQFTILCEFFDRTPSKAYIEMYYNLLRNSTEQQFSRAVGQLLTTRKYTKMPLPAEILENINGNVEDRAILAVDQISKAMQKHGSYSSIVFDDNVINHVVNSHPGGWIKLCETTYEEWHFLKKDFIKRYIALSNRKDTLQPIAALPGRTEVENGTKGIHHESQDVKMIVNATKALPEASKPIKALK